MMELNRIASHLVWLGTTGLELGAISMMLYGFREREYILEIFEMVTGLRMNMAYVRPGGVAQDVPPEAITKIREFLDADAQEAQGVRGAAHRASRSGSSAPRVWPLLDVTGCLSLGVTGPVLRSAGLGWDLRKQMPYCGYETYEFDVPTATTADVWGRYEVRVAEMRESLKIIEQCLDRLKPGPMMVADKKIAWPAQLAMGVDGLGNSLEHVAKIMGQSMESLIHHFKLVTEGFRVPAGQVYLADRGSARRARCARRLRRWDPAVPGALPRTELHQPAGDPGHGRGWPDRRRHRRRRFAGPGHGWV